LNKEDIKKYWEFLDQDEVDVRAFTPGETELDKKISKGGRWVKSKKDFIRFCQKYNGKANIYAGVLPREKKSKEGITKINKIWVELDAEREEDGATPEESLEEAKEVMQKIRNDFRDYGLPLVVMSGNGYHLIWKIKPVKVNDRNREKVDKKLKAFIKEIKEEYETEKVEIDTAVGDLARILKFPELFL